MDKFDEMVEELERNEDLVECKECFDLFPKADCVKDKLGYICPACYRAAHRGEDSRINSKTITTDLFDQDFPEVDDYDPGTVTDYADDPKLADAFDFLINDEVEAIDGYNKVSKVVQDSELDPEDKDATLEVLNHIKDEEKEHQAKIIKRSDECNKYRRTTGNSIHSEHQKIDRKGISELIIFRNPFLLYRYVHS